MNSLRTNYSSLQRQRGVAFIVMMVILVLGTTTILVSSLNSASLQISRDQVTADALAQAKEALIGYAASVRIDFTPCAAPGNNCTRVGDLPCPDRNNDGVAELSCGDASGSFQSRRIGRLPWKTLGLPDLRDGSGERLWYAVSNNFKENTRTICTNANLSGCLNSDTVGTISIYAPDGSLLNDGSGNTGVVAVIIAPGDVLTRQGGALQDRSGPDNGAAKNTASNYLDIVTSVEDNADFVDAAPNGFIQGRIRDANGNVIVNDQLLTVTQDNIMLLLQKRVAAEVKQCLNEYATDPQNMGRYPWAAKLDTPGQPVNYDDTSNRLFGRVPDIPFDKTWEDSAPHMNDTWPATCNINSSSGWWRNWKEMVFYGLADAYKPKAPMTIPSCGTCLTANPPAATVDKKFVVIVAGRTLPSQSRSNADKNTLGNYLEAPNNAGASPFAQGTPTTTFNDTLVYQ